MQLDMHFFAVYTLARAVGFAVDDAKTIAQASQFVDDATEDATIEFDTGPAIRPAMTSHTPLDYKNSLPTEQWNVWVPFHFLPGNDNSTGDFEQRMECKKDSLLANKVLEFALSNATADFGLHLAGIALHVYADTFSHHGFIGLASKRNFVAQDSITLKTKSKSIMAYLKSKLSAVVARVEGTFAEAVPVGHGSVGALPDRPYLTWSYRRQGSPKITNRDNAVDYLLACRNMYTFLQNLLNKSGKTALASTPWTNIQNAVNGILTRQAPLDGRIDAWLNMLAGKKLVSYVPKDAEVWYEEKEWSSPRLILSGQPNCGGALFMQAAWLYRNYVLHDLLKNEGLVAF